MNRADVVVFGGCNIDISGKSAREIAMYDSNLGEVTMTPGGVGRNIASNVASMGISTALVTALGDDHQKEIVFAEKPEKLSFEEAFVFSGEATGSYLAVLDSKGELYTAINDMRVLDRLTKEKVARRRELAEGAHLVVVDANLREDALAEIFSWNVWILADGVSAIKVLKFRPFLDRIDVLKCNVLEARALSGLEDEADLFDCGEALYKKGARRVLITAGSDGAYLFSEKETVHFKTAPMTIRGATGAGDAFAGMLAAGLVKGDDLIDATVSAMAASRLVLKSDRSDLSGCPLEAWAREKQEVSYDII